MKKNVLYVVIVVLLILVVSGVTYLLLDNKNNKMEEYQNNSKNNDKEDNKEDNKQDEIVLSEEELEKYLSYIPQVDYYNTEANFNVYRSPSNVNKMSDIDLINNALVTLIDKNLVEEDFDFPIEVNPFEFRIALKDVKEIVYKEYNVKNFKIISYDLSEEINENYSARYGAFIYYDNYFYGWNACAECGEDNHVGYVQDYVVSDDKLEIYELAGYYSAYLGDNCQNHDVITNYISSISYSIPYRIKTDGWCEYEMEPLEYLKINKDKFTKYKHTFKKNDKGYYWYSTEVVES